MTIIDRTMTNSIIMKEPSLKNLVILLAAFLPAFLQAQESMNKMNTAKPMYFLNAGVFFSPKSADMVFNPALDVELGFWKTNKKNFFSWGASAEVWYFTSIQYELNNPVIMNNTDGFINLNAMFFYDNKIITPYIAPTVSLASDFKKAGFAGGIALGLNHKTAKRLQTFVQAKYIKFSNKLNYLDMHFFMVGLSLNLSD